MRKLFFQLALSAALSFPLGVAGQDYVQYETQYLRVLPGHSADFEEALAEHNQRFHADGAYTDYVDFIVNGPRSGQMLWIMGPSTFSDLDGRPSDEAHGSDWSREVLAHAETNLTEYWRRNERLSSPRPSTDATVRPLQRTRFFDVADNALFEKTQEQIEAVTSRMGLEGRMFYRRQFGSQDGRDWILVTSHENWAELDATGASSFQETFVEVHGLAAWSLYLDERAAAVSGVQDEWRRRVPALGGSGS